MQCANLFQGHSFHNRKIHLLLEAHFTTEMISSTRLRFSRFNREARVIPPERVTANHHGIALSVQTIKSLQIDGERRSLHLDGLMVSVLPSTVMATFKVT